MVLKKPQSVGKKFKIKNYYARTLLRRKAIGTNGGAMSSSGLRVINFQITTND